MIKTSIKGVIPFVQKKRRRTCSCGSRNLRLFFFRRVERRVSKFCSTCMDTVSTTPSRKLPRTDSKDCLCHCRDASGKQVDSDIDLD